MDATLRKTSALITKDLRDIVKNPYMLVCCLLPIGFVFLYSNVLGGDASASPEAAAYMSSYLLSISLCMTAGMTGSMLVLYAIAEEKEKNTLRTLMLANVHARQIIISRAFVSLLIIMILDAICYAIVDGPKGDFASYLIIGLTGSIPIVLVSLLFGLAARDQMTAGLYSTPVIFAALAPMFGAMNEGIGNVVRYFPTGGMDELVKLSVAGNLFTSEAVAPALVTLAWIVIALAAFALLFKRLTRDN